MINPIPTIMDGTKPDKIPNSCVKSCFFSSCFLVKVALIKQHGFLFFFSPFLITKNHTSDENTRKYHSSMGSVFHPSHCSCYALLVMVN